MKYLLSLFIALFITNNISAQQNDKYLGKVFLRNGKVFSLGYKILEPTGPLKCERIKYKSDKNTQFVHDCKEIEKVRSYELDSIGRVKDSTDYYFKFHKKKFELLEKVNVKGKMELYQTEVIQGGAIMNSGMPGLSMTTGPSSVFYMYYLGKKYNTKVTVLPRRKASKKFRQVLATYYTKCPALTGRMKNKTFFKERSVKEIVSFFNENCN